MNSIKYKINNSKKEIIAFSFLFIISVLIIYKTPQIVGTVFQIILLIAFWNSKRDYFWLAFLFVIESSPGALFSLNDALHNFSLFSTPGIGNFYFHIPFLILALVKSYFKMVSFPRNFLSGIFIILFFYFILILSANGIYKWTAILRLTFPWLLLFIIPRLIKDERDYAQFFNLIFPFVIFFIATQIFKIVTAQEFASLLGGTGNPAVAANKDILESSTAIRPTDGIMIPFLSLLGTTYFLTKRNKKYFSNNYLHIIMILSVLSIFLTATRSWLIAAIFITAGFLILNSGKPLKTLLKYSVIGAAIFLIIILIPTIQKQVVLSFERYETLGYLLKGDITAGGTLQRFDVRAPRVMAKFYEKPFFGWGYGETAAAYSDGHVGHQNLLLHTGVIGYCLFLLLWIMFIIKLLNITRITNKKSEYYKIPLVLIVFFLGIHIINVSAQWFGFLVSFTTGFVLSFLFSLANMVYWETLKEEKRLELEYKCKE